jgi:hypothetical protein
MNTDPKLPKPGKLLHDLEHNEELQHQPVPEAELDPHLALLRTWQSERLTRTYADLLADKRYRPACLFFLSDIYAPRDFSQRDHDVERIHAFLAKILPAQMLQLLTEVIELNSLTNALDRRLVEVLVQKLNVTDTITPELYAEGYRVCANYTGRVHQIELTARVMVQVGEGARLVVIGPALKLARGPAQRAGWVELFDYLEHGYAAFKQMRDAKAFVQVIEQREMLILDQIFASHPDPFSV